MPPCTHLLPGCLQNLTIAEVPGAILASPVGKLAVPKVRKGASLRFLLGKQLPTASHRTAADPC